MTATTSPPQAIDPSTGEPLPPAPHDDPSAVDRAVATARAAQRGWAATPAAERGAALRRVAAAVREHAEALASLNARETGKLIGDARGGVEAAAATIEQYAELGPLHRGRALEGDRLALDVMRYEPRGVVAALIPFNDPIAIAGQGLAAALATGNTVVLKPSERAPRCGALLHRLFAERLPEGVVVLLQGDGRVGRPLAAHEDVDVVVHTGSAETGREIAVACARRGAHAVLELGGNDPLVVDADVDVEWAAAQAASGAFANAGQICVAVERIYVHAAIADAFIDALVARAEALKVGPATDPCTRLGPLVDERARRSVHAQVEASVAAGATVRCGGAPLDGPGCFYPATVLTDVDETMAVMAHETFGPVAPVRVVADLEEAVTRANATPYGLGATVLTADQAHAARAVAELRAGTVKVNAVWGGAPGGAAHPRGISGTALGYGPELLDELTMVKVVHTEAAPARSASRHDADGERLRR